MYKVIDSETNQILVWSLWSTFSSKQSGKKAATTKITFFFNMS